MPLFSESDNEAQLVFWPHLQSAMLSVHNGWEIWAEYYAFRLEGRSFDLPLFDVTASLGKSYWNRKPTDLNAKLCALVDAIYVGFGEDEQEDISSDQINVIDQQSFENWLEDKPVEWAQVLAMRIALRALPFVASLSNDDRLSADSTKGFEEYAFRACAIAWSACKFITHEFRIEASDAVTRTYPLAYPATSTFIASNAAVSAAGSAASAVASAIGGVSDYLISSTVRTASEL